MVIQQANRFFIPFIFLASLFLVFNRHSRSCFDNYHSVNWADAAGYYVYLPAFFIYDFNASEFPENIEQNTGNGFQLDPVTNRVVTKYPYGVSVMQAPFFLVAHGISGISGIEHNGYNPIYYRSILIAAVSYLALGLFFLKKFLEKYFNSGCVLITLLAVYTGTNLYYYAINSGGYSHIYSFALFAAFLYLTDRFYSSPDIRTALMLGIISATIVLVRPVNAAVLLWFVFYNVRSWTGVAERILLFKKNSRTVIMMIGSAMIMAVPQLLYWNYMSGHWFPEPYPGETFSYLKAPKIAEVLFSTNNGWILYTPLVLVMVSGLGWMMKKKLPNAGIISLILAIVLYVYSSWWNWWYGCSYGSRNFVEYYTLLSLPFAYVVSGVLRRRIAVKALFSIFCGICIYLNLNTIYHYDDCWYGGTWDWSEYFKIITK